MITRASPIPQHSDTLPKIKNLQNIATLKIHSLQYPVDLIFTIYLSTHNFICFEILLRALQTLYP